MFSKLREKYKNKLNLKAENKRLEVVYSEFQKEYWELCKKYKVQWVPILITSKMKTGEMFFVLRMQLQTHNPIEIKQSGDVEISTEPPKENATENNTQ
jgi:hypothetical protein